MLRDTDISILSVRPLHSGNSIETAQHIVIVSSLHGSPIILQFSTNKSLYLQTIQDSANITIDGE